MGTYLVQMTSSCRLPWQRWHWVQRRVKRSSRAFRWDTWGAGVQWAVHTPTPTLGYPVSHLPLSGTAPTPGAGRTCTQLLGAVSTGAMGPSQVWPPHPAPSPPAAHPGCESPQRPENKGASV